LYLALLAEQRQMEVKLVVVGGAEAQAGEFALRLPTVIGRSRTADLPLANPLVSRRHCEIFEADGQLMVRDLGSLNGTFIGKTRVTDEAAVAPGSLLTIGAIIFRADYAGANGAAHAAAGPAAVEKPAAAAAGDESTVSVDDLEALEPMGEGSDDAEFNLAWLEEGTADSGQSNGAPAGQAAVKETVSSQDAAKKTAPAKAAAPGGAKAKAASQKTTPADQSDNLDDLDDLVK
jgi:pSer/pThr/pTyr-binding forkhead associated (FHA) protein